MKRRSPNIAFIFLLVLSAVTFAYFNFCPSVTNHGMVSTNYAMTMPKDFMKYPELEGLIELGKVLLSFFKP